MAGATHAEQMYGTGDQRTSSAEASGPGWALVGDSAHHKDSITARGITDAFLQAELLVELVADGLHDEPRLAAALEAYGTRLLQELSPRTRAPCWSPRPTPATSAWRAAGGGHQPGPHPAVLRHRGRGAPGLKLYTPELLALLPPSLALSVRREVAVMQW